MYGIAKAGASGSVVTLIGSRNSDSGGNSLSPEMLINPEIRPTKVDRPSDVTGMVDTGNLTGILSDPQDVVAVMESIARISGSKLAKMDTKLITQDQVVKDLVQCGYLKAADLADRFAGVNIDPASDADIVGPTGIFSQAEFDDDSEFRKTASVMKMVVDGYAGAGTITMGGYDYHTGDRSTGEIRDLRAGRCIGACLEYAARRGIELMVYVFSDGSVASNGRIDNSVDGRGKGEWTGDNSSTAGSFFLVHSPTARPVLMGATPEEQAIHQQIGYMRMDASVETASSAAANNPNLLTHAVILNYMALNGDQALYSQPEYFGTQGINAGLIDTMTAFTPIV